MVDKNKETSAPATPAATSQEAPAASNTTIESHKAFAFIGQHFPSAVVRTFTTDDPSNPGRVIKTNKRFDLITNLVIERVSGMGFADKTGEKYVTLSGQYAPFGTARITASSQNADAVLALLKDNVDKTNKELPLKKKIVVETVCTPMRGFGFTVNELYLVNEDGSKKVIIGAPAQAAEEQVESMLL